MRFNSIKQLSSSTKLLLVVTVLLITALFLTINQTQQQQQTRQNAATSNLINNGSFENTGTSWLSPWNFKVTAPAVGSITQSTTAINGLYSARLDVDQPSSTASDFQITQSGISLIGGHTYHLTFSAQTSIAPHTVTVFVRNGPGQTVYADFSHTIGTVWSTISFNFIQPTTDATAFVSFNMAQQQGTVFLDNISLTDLTGANTPTPRPTNTPTPRPTNTPTPSLTNTPTPLPTSTPRPTNTPTPLPTSTPPPSNTPAPTNTPVPSSTQFAFTLLLHGIGNGGDSANPQSQGNMNPVHPQRILTVQVYNSQNQLVLIQQGTVTYNSTQGNFTGTIDMGTTLTSGFYTVWVKTDKYLGQFIPGIQTITQSQINQISQAALVVGDINGDNSINILDYNLLLSCTHDFSPTPPSTCANEAQTDLDDSGSTNSIDVNLFLRELSNRTGQ